MRRHAAKGPRPRSTHGEDWLEVPERNLDLLLPLRYFDDRIENIGQKDEGVEL